MVSERDNRIVKRLNHSLQWAVTLACIAVLASCVTEIDNIGGGHDSNKKMAGIFFFHLFLIVPCLFGLFVYLQLKLEKFLLSKETIESLNEAHMKYAEKEASAVFGSFAPLFNALFKHKRKK